jgi:hypothetical protein
MSFFNAKPPAGSTTPGVGAGASSGSPSKPAASSQQRPQASQQAGSQQQQQGGGGGDAATTGKREKSFCELFPKPEGANLRRWVRAGGTGE